MSLSMLPLLVRFLCPPMKPIISDIGRSESRGALVGDGDDVVVMGTALGLAPKVAFSLSARLCSFWSLFFLPMNHRSTAATMPMIAMIPMARPALAPVDIPPLLCDDDESEDEVDEAPETSVLDVLSKEVTADVAVAKLLAAEVIWFTEDTIAEEATIEEATAEDAVEATGAT